MKRLLLFCVLLGYSLHLQALVILQYHHISDTTPAATSTSPELFEKHLNIIADAGFQVVDLQTVAARVRDGEPLPDKAVLITFDDSYLSIYSTAFPLLKARHWPFVVFANTGPVDSGSAGFMTWAQLEEMAAAGAAIANHTDSHLHLVRRPVGVSVTAWHERVQREIEHAETRIKEHVGQSFRVLAFPFGEYDRDLLELLENMGYLAMSQSSGAVASTDRLVLPRFPMGGRYGEPADFSLKLRALPLPVLERKVSTETGRVLQDGVLPADVGRPVLAVRLGTTVSDASMQCYASGQTAAIEKTRDGEWLQFQTQTPLPAGRSRYNCTARDPDTGRFRWFSIPWLKPRADGTWPPEP